MPLLPYQEVMIVKITINISPLCPAIEIEIFTVCIMSIKIFALAVITRQPHIEVATLPKAKTTATFNHSMVEPIITMCLEYHTAVHVLQTKNGQRQLNLTFMKHIL